MSNKFIVQSSPLVISLGVNQRASYRWVSRTGVDVGKVETFIEASPEFKAPKSEYEEVMDAQDAIDKLKP